MKKAQIELLTCPRTGAPLTFRGTTDGDGDAASGTLEGDGASYPVRDGIPSFVPDEVLSTQTVRSFADKWATHKYYRSHTGEFYTQWYLQRYGFFDPANLRDFLSRRKFILDAGTGSGRDAVNFATFSSATVFAVDTARPALEMARREVANDRVAFVHADINRLPFPDGFFDFINCDQVIHHTPDPRATFETLAAKLRRGGHICCYVYRRKAVIREFTDDHIRAQLSRLPAGEAMRACEGITQLGRALAAQKLTIDIPEDIPALGIRKGKADLQRFFHWNVMKCFWNDQFDFFTNNIVNFDWYHPEYCFRYEPEEFRAWFATGWEVESWNVQEAGISCRAQRI